MQPDDLRALIRRALPDAEVHCQDLTGTGDHWHLDVVSDHFVDLRLLAQHRAVKDALAEQLADRTIHALSLKTWTHAAWAAR